MLCFCDVSFIIVDVCCRSGNGLSAPANLPSISSLSFETAPTVVGCYRELIWYFMRLGLSHSFNWSERLPANIKCSRPSRLTHHIFNTELVDPLPYNTDTLVFVCPYLHLLLVWSCPYVAWLCLLCLLV